MDQLTVQDFDYTAGYGGFKYGIVFCSLRSDYWVFIPLRTLGCSDAHAGFRQFCIIHQLRSDEVAVYCDAHQSLRQICYIEGIPVEHPPPARPDANALIERKIGLAMSCHRSTSVQAGFPTCLWPCAMHARSINYNIAHIGSDGKSNYYRAFGRQPKTKEVFISGELVFFRPSPTIVSCTLPKSSGRLLPGIFLDYYTPRAGELSGQFIVCPLADFDGKSLHVSAPKSTFKLRLNRTEVIKRKANCVMPIFPLKARYNKANYSLDGADGSAIDLSSSKDYAEVIDDVTEEGVWGKELARTLSLTRSYTTIYSLLLRR